MPRRYFSIPIGAGSEVDRALVHGKCRFFDRFGQRRVSVAGPGDILAARSEFDGDRRFRNQLTRMSTNDVHTKDAVSAGIGQNLDLPIEMSTSTSAAVCDEGEDTLSVFNSTLFELFLGRSNGPDFGFRIHHAGNGVVVHVTIAGEQLLDAGNAFFLGLVRQHRPANDVAGRKDARHGRLVMRVDRDEAAFVCCHSDGFQAESFGIRLAADSDQYAIAFD